MTRVAWCVKCDGPRDVDEDGCVTCWMRERDATANWDRVREKPSSPKRVLAASKRRRDRLKRLGRCINGLSHALPEHGRTKCPACVETHRRTR